MWGALYPKHYSNTYKKYLLNKKKFIACIIPIIGNQTAKKAEMLPH